MKRPIDKARHFLAEAAGQNDNQTRQPSPVAFYGPVTIVLGSSSKKTAQYIPGMLRDTEDDHQVPAYLARRRERLTAIPPYRH